MTTSLHFLLAISFLASCGDNTTTEATPDAGDDGTDPPAPGVLFARGIAGDEQLLYTDGAAEPRVLSQRTSAPLCGERIYCDFPPSPILSRILFYDFADDRHAVYLEVDYANPANSTIQIAPLDGSGRRVASADIDWVTAEPGRPGWIFAHARRRSLHYWSLLTESGMQLFRHDGSGELSAIRTFAIPTGEHVIASWIVATDDGLAWSVETARQQPQLSFQHYSWLLAADGESRFSWEDLPAGAMPCDPALLRGGTYSVSYHLPADPRFCHTRIVDVATLAGRDLSKTEPSLPRPPDLADSLSPDGRRTFELAYDLDTTFVYDTTTGALVDTISGEATVWADADRLVIRTDIARLDLRDVAARTSTRIAGDTGGTIGFWGFNRPDQIVGAGGSTLVAVSGATFSDLSENVGLHAVDLATGTTNVIEAPAVTEEFFRNPRLTADAKTLVYLHQVGAQLDIVAVDLATNTKRTLVASPEPERGFVLGKL